MINIAFYSISTILILFGLGYGLILLTIPKKLTNYALWLTPWFTMVFLIFFLTLFSLAGLSVKQITPLLVGILLLLTIYAFVKRKLRYVFHSKEDILIALFILTSIVFNLSPLILHEKFLTTISMGNNDVIVYSVVPDYLLNHSIIESFNTPVALGVSNLLTAGYRWGPPLISAFFLYLFDLQGYQFAYLFQVILFGLTLPLIYIFLKMMYRQTLWGLLLSLTLTAFNTNLLYMLYHDFFGQVLFWGLELFLLILIYTYLNIDQSKTYHLNFYDISIGVAFSVLFISYHEGAIFILFPLLLFLIVKSILRKKVKNDWFSFAKIMLVMFLTGSIVFVRGIVYDYLQSLGANPNQPIGWQLFRQELPFANPFEMIGFYSIHLSPPLPIIIALILSLVTFIVILYGITKAKNRLYLISLSSVYLLFYIWTGVYQHHFWNYNRAITYTLPIVVIFFTIGILELFRRWKLVTKYVVFILIGLEIFSAIKLNKRFLREHLTVDNSFISLRELRSQNFFSEPIYTESVLDDTISYWRQIWAGYFLYGDNPAPSLPPDVTPFEKRIPDKSLILLSKATPWVKPPQVLLSSTVWENQYYLLGRLCNSPECLLNRPEDLTGVTLGKNTFEDSLLISGWSAKESSNRWAIGKESTLRLVTKDSRFKQLSFEAQTLQAPQTVTVYFDGKLLGTKSISTQWLQYNFPIPERTGVHQIRFVYGYTYKPSEILESQDTRELAVNFRWIGLKQN